MLETETYFVHDPYISDDNIYSKCGHYIYNVAIAIERVQVCLEYVNNYYDESQKKRELIEAISIILLRKHSGFV